MDLASSTSAVRPAVSSLSRPGCTMIREMTCVWEKLPPTSNRFASSAAPFGGDNWPSGQGLGSRGRDGNHLQVRGGRSALADRPDAEHTPAVPVPSLSQSSIAHRPRRHGPKLASNSPDSRAESVVRDFLNSPTVQERIQFHANRFDLVWPARCVVFRLLRHRGPDLCSGTQPRPGPRPGNQEQLRDEARVHPAGQIHDGLPGK